MVSIATEGRLEKGFIIKLSRCAGALTNIDTLRTRSPVIAVHWVQGNLCFKRDQSRLSELGGWVLVFATFTVCNRTMILGPTSPPSRAGGQLFVMVYLFWMTSATEQGLCILQPRSLSPVLRMNVSPWRTNPSYFLSHSLQNLLRTLTESQVKPAADLRLLLTTVKETRVRRTALIRIRHLTAMILSAASELRL